MGRLDRYIGSALLKGWLLVWLIISAIFSLLAFVDELEQLALHDGLAGVGGGDFAGGVVDMCGQEAIGGGRMAEAGNAESQCDGNDAAL